MQLQLYYPHPNRYVNSSSLLENSPALLNTEDSPQTHSVVHRNAPQAFNDEPLQLVLFGPPQLTRATEPVTLARRQLRGLLYYMGANLKPVARDQLCFLFWPDIADGAARRNLTVLLNQLRQALPHADMVQTQGDTIILNPARIQTDTAAFVAATTPAACVENLDGVSRALALYKGSFLAGFSLPASAEFDDWIAQERHLWERRFLEAATMLIHAYSNRSAHQEAIAVAQRALEVDPSHEGLHRQLMMLHAAADDRRAALRQFEECVVLLERELGVSPLPETRAVYDAIRRGETIGSPLAVAQNSESSNRLVSSAAPLLDLPAASEGMVTAPPSPHVLHHALPAPMGQLLGREPERAAIRALLGKPDVRLLTLTGTGGSGKTRLAIQAAWDVAEQFTDGAAFVALAPVRDPELVVQAIGQACGLSQSTPHLLADYLSSKALLIVLDNCEHLMVAAPAIGSLLAAAPRVRVLATSRTPLNLQGEHMFPVPPLPLPDLTKLPPLSTLAAIPSVALLLQRTQALNPRFELTQENADDIAAICVRLDGLPLALELVAARLKLLAPRDLVRRLDRRLALLTHGPQDLPERQRTLRATIYWSYNLLDLHEQLWFECCSVFVGGWTLAALEGMQEQLHRAGTMNVNSPDLLDVLAALVDKSLIQMQSGDSGEPRFDLLETIREFAAERLHVRGTAGLVAQAHADSYLALIAPWDVNAPAWLAKIEAELDNLRTALRWYLSRPGQIEAALRLGKVLRRFWYWRDMLTESRLWLDQLVAKSEGIESEARAEILAGAALQATVQGDTVRVLELHAETLRLCELLNLSKQRSNTLTALGTLYARKGDLPRAIGYLEESLTVAQQVDNPDTLSTAYYMLAGTLVDEGNDIPRALILYEEALSIARAHQRAIVESMTLAALGIAYALSGHLNRAAELLPQALAMQQAMNAVMSLGWTHQYMGILAYLQEDDGRAARHFLESLEAAPRGGSHFIVPLSLEGIAGVLAQRQQPTQAAQLLGAAEALRENIELPHAPIEQPLYTTLLTNVQRGLSPEEFHIARQHGRQLTMSEAISKATIAIRSRGNH